LIIPDELESGESINLPQLSQPLCTALQIALVELLKSFHIAPVAVIGHSSGEIAAAYAVGALSLDSACRVSYHRGRLSGRLAAQLDVSSRTGAMMSANLQEGRVRAYIDRLLPGADIQVACVNSPSNVTLAGTEADIDALKHHLDNDSIFAQKLKTGIAYHTTVMQELVSEYVACLDNLDDSTLEPNTTLMVSSVTGQKIAATDLLTAQYWADNLTSPVRFVDALQYLAQAAPRLDGIKAISDYIEIGPHGALKRPATETLSQLPNYREFAYLSVLSKHLPPLKTTMEVAGHLFTRGFPVSIMAVNQHTADASIPMILSDTPKYPFDRTQRYWHESRLSRDWRLRGAAPRSVLGIRATDWNPLEPRWRKMLSIQETPWIAEHVIAGVIVFPAAGMIVMALEAVKQTAQSQEMLSGFLVKEATFANPIFVETERKTEVVTQLRAIKQAYEREALRFEVVIYSIDNDGRWTECFKAIVNAQPEKSSMSEVDRGHEAHETGEACFSRYKEAKLSCTKRVVPQDFYHWLDKQGLFYGEAFALSKDIFWDGNELCVARVDNSQEAYEGVVHPTVLDNCLQLCCTSPSEGMTKTLSTFIPSSVRDLWISATGWQHPQTDAVQIMTRAKLNIQSTGLNCSMMAFSEAGKLLCHAKHLGMSAVAGKASTDNSQKRLLHSIDWRPQLSLLTKQQLSEHCKLDSKDDETLAIEYCVSLGDAIRAQLERILPQLQDSVESRTTPDHLKRFVTWIERQLRQTSGKTVREISNAQLVLELETLRETRPSWRLYLDVLENLPSIIRGETDALDLFFTTPVAHDLYDAFFSRTCNQKLFNYLELAVHQNPSQKILEVGAGTGGMTNQILTMLHQIEQRTGGTSFREYVYTDISPAYFEAARERFAGYRTRISFKTLDLERDVSANIEPGSCDMILAGSVLHVTKNLTATMRNLRRALKPGGQLVFLEITQAPECFPMSFGFGVLPGWWCAEEKSRQWCPTLTEVQWDTLLKETGFSGNELLVKDYEDPRANFVTIITSTAIETLNAVTEVSRVLLVINDYDEQQKSLASGLSNAMSGSSTYQVVVSTLSRIAEAEVLPTDHIVFLADMKGYILAEPSNDEFRLIQTWLQQSKHLLWVTAALSSQQFSPRAGIKDGLLRVIRAENNSKRVISLTLEHDASDIETCQQCIVHVFRSAFEDASPELEYIVRDGKVLTGRLVLEADLNRDVNACISPITRHEAWLPGPPLKLHVGSRGSLESLCFIEDEHPAELGPTEIEIETQAWAVGFRDVFGALGRLDENEFGTDCAGTVKRIGSQCTQLLPGDRVSTSMFGCMRTYVHCDETDAFKVPDTLSVDEACGVINPVMTAWYALVNVARLQKGEKILIHSASGGTGQVAIQVAQMLGAEVYVTVGYDHKKQLLIEQYGIPAANIFYSRDLSFVQGILRVTNGYGVDVVLNSLVGEGQKSSWECVAPYGRFIEIGKADIYANASLPMASFANNRTFSAVDIRDLAFHRQKVSKALFHRTMDLVREGAIYCPKPINKFPVSAIEDAFRYLQSGKSSGRIIVTLEHSDKVPASP
jgi:NADPH:quinone reductase-like Zn-dependent oxidoreductase/malonyl CoA-acyl carrier protein transacylase/SAM-dependent methyltransferase